MASERTTKHGLPAVYVYNAVSLSALVYPSPTHTRQFKPMNWFVIETSLRDPSCVELARLCCWARSAVGEPAVSGAVVAEGHGGGLYPGGAPPFVFCCIYIYPLHSAEGNPR